MTRSCLMYLRNWSTVFIHLLPVRAEPLVDQFLKYIKQLLVIVHLSFAYISATFSLEHGVGDNIPEQGVDVVLPDDIVNMNLPLSPHIRRLYHFCSRSKQTELIQYLLPVLVGPSSNT